MKAIIIYGNIASGKSTLATLLLKKLHDYSLISLDQLRIEMHHFYHHLSPIARERKAEEKCLHLIGSYNSIIFETTAATRFWKQCFLTMNARNMRMFFVDLHCSANTCIKRFNYRNNNGHFQVAPPYSKKLTIEQSINSYQRRLHTVHSNIKLDSELLSPAQMLFHILNSPLFKQF